MQSPYALRIGPVRLLIDDDAVPYLQKMTGLRKLTLEGTGITDEGAEQIDDALPNCRVIY